MGGWKDSFIYSIYLFDQLGVVMWNIIVVIVIGTVTVEEFMLVKYSLE